MHEIEPPTRFTKPYLAKAGKGRLCPILAAKSVLATAAIEDVNSTADGGDSIAV